MKICCVAAGGGHLTELLELVEEIKEYDKFLVAVQSNSSAKNDFFERYYFIKQPTHSLSNLILSAIQTFKILLKERPSIILSCGSEITILFFYFGKIFFRTKNIFVECSAQVYLASITGRVVYYVSDLFLVQWQYLKKKYGKKAKYMGGLI